MKVRAKHWSQEEKQLAKKLGIKLVHVKKAPKKKHLKLKKRYLKMQVECKSCRTVKTTFYLVQNDGRSYEELKDLPSGRKFKTEKRMKPTCDACEEFLTSKSREWLVKELMKEKCRNFFAFR